MLLSRTKAGFLVLAAVLILPLAAPAQEYQRETDRLAEEIAAAVTKAELRNVAVMDFTDLQGNVQEIGRFMAEEITTSLVLQNRTFKTIDRANLRSILSEQKLTMTGLVNPENARKLKISGVDGLIRGSLTPFGDGIRITIQIIAVETAQIVGAARGVVPKTSAMDSLGGAIEDSAGPAADGAPHSSSGSKSPGAAKKGKYVVQDSTLRVTLQVFRKDAEGTSIKAVFLVENLKDKGIVVYWNDIRVVDELGGEWSWQDSSGIRNWAYPEPLGPVASLTGFATFQPKRVPGRGTKFTIVGSLHLSDDSSRQWLSTPTFRDVPSDL